MKSFDLLLKAFKYEVFFKEILLSGLPDYPQSLEIFFH